MVYVKPYILDPAVVVTNMILNIRAGGHPASSSRVSNVLPDANVYYIHYIIT